MKKRFNERTPEILMISSYPPRECGIATFSQDLIKALDDKFYQSFSFKICALENGEDKHEYGPEVKYVIDTTDAQAFESLADSINQDSLTKLVLLQHEFGFFAGLQEREFLDFLHQIKKPLVLTFHTVLPKPDPSLKKKISDIVMACDGIVVMTKNAANILIEEYGLPKDKITVIAHGIHLVPHLDKTTLKQKYGLGGRKILSTFGLISSGKSIETTLEALPAIVAQHPNVLFLAIGKTHPSVVKHEGEQYRRQLEAKVAELSLENHVKFINKYLPLEELLEYLQLTDIYLFTSKDPNQAVSGTFSYAMSCGCAIVSTPIPHAQEVLREDSGILFDFQNAAQLSKAVNLLLGDKALRKRMIHNSLQYAVHAAWENTAIAYAHLFKKCTYNDLLLRYAFPEVNLGHLKKMTTQFGMIQFAKINQPDLESGFTIDDNARALVAMCMHYELFNDKEDLLYIKTYLDFITYCLQSDGSFLNYINKEELFTDQNEEVNLEDANGRAIWALGYLISKQQILPEAFTYQAKAVLKSAMQHIPEMYSTRAMAFSIKGLHYSLQTNRSLQTQALLETLADRLVKMYRHESVTGWKWYESYLTYGNSTIPEAMLCAWMSTGNPVYRNIARQSFEFLLEETFTDAGIKVIPNRGWLQKGGKKAQFGEQPIDVAYTIMALHLFHEAFGDEQYKEKLETAFNWFLGHNHLRQIIYNPCTGGCYDGLEESQVNLNQGAESTVSYLMARLVTEKSFLRRGIITNVLQAETSFGTIMTPELMFQ